MRNEHDAINAGIVVNPSDGNGVALTYKDNLSNKQSAVTVNEEVYISSAAPMVLRSSNDIEMEANNGGNISISPTLAQSVAETYRATHMTMSDGAIEIAAGRSDLT